MKSEETAKIAKVTERTIRRRAKKAIDDDINFIMIGKDKYFVEQVIDKDARGKVYEYTLEEKKKEVLSPDVTLKIGRKFLAASEEAKSEALLKCRLVEDFTHREHGITAAKFIKELNHIYDELMVNGQKLFRWVALYDDAREKEHNPAEYLLDKRGKNSFSKLTQEMKEMAERMLTSRKRTRSKKTIYLDMLHHFGDAMPSYDTLSRYLESWKLKNPFAYEFSQNPDSAKNKYMMSAGSYSEGVSARNQVWELDSTPADIICSDGKRYAILAALDVFSRRVVFHLDERSSSYSIARLLRKAIKTLGIPDVVVTDNGKDYTSNHFASVCQALGIYQKIVPPFSGDAKPHVERVFRTLSGELFESLDGYIGHNVAQRSALQAQKSFEDKQNSMAQFHAAKKKLFQDSWKFKKENLGLSLKTTMDSEKLASIIDKWNANIYEQREHSTLKMTPMNKWNKCSFEVKSIADPRMLDILTGEYFTRKVGKEGIRVDNAHYVSADLIEHAGKHVFIMTPPDWGHIFVFSTEYEPLCIAEDPEKLGIPRSHYKDIKAKSKAHMKILHKMYKEWEKFDVFDPNIKTRIDEAVGMVGAKTAMTMKHTPIIEAVAKAGEVFAKKDAEQAEDSHTYNMQGQKLMPSGRPQFNGFYERFLWELENDCFDEKSKKLAEKHPASFKMANEEFERRKAS